MKVVELKVTITMTDQQMHDYAEEFGVDMREVLRDVHDNLVYDVEDLFGDAKSNFWTAVVQ